MRRGPARPQAERPKLARAGATKGERLHGLGERCLTEVAEREGCLALCSALL